MQNQKEKNLASKVIISTRQMSGKWQAESTIDGHLSEEANKHQMQDFLNYILQQPFYFNTLSFEVSLLPQEADCRLPGKTPLKQE